MPNFNQNEKNRGRPRVGLEPVLIRDLAAAGLSDAEIAARLGVSSRTILSLRRAHSIPPGQGHGGRRAGAGRKPGTAKNRKNPPWRGRADWPAREVATRRTLSDRDLVCWIAQEYIQVKGMYRFDEDRAGIRPSDVPGSFRF